MALDQRLRLNSILGSFQVTRLIGKGGMGEVYEAYEPILERKVALKIISKEASHDEFTVKSFRNEGKALAQINHPYVVSIYSFGEDQGIEYIAMEYVEGENLKQKIRNKEYDLRQSIFIFKQVLSGIKALHANNIIHRDLKPPNIILQQNGKPKIVDFGIAKRVREHTITATGIEKKNIMGSIYYISPELLSGQPASVQADIWSLGVIFYEMITFLRPFRGKDQEAIMEGIFNKNLEFSPYVKTTLPRAVQTIIKKMCAKNPSQRYPNIESIEEDLIRWEKSDPNFNIKLDNDPDLFENIEKTSVKDSPTHTFSKSKYPLNTRSHSITNISAQDRLKGKRQDTLLMRKSRKKRKQASSKSNIFSNSIAVVSVLIGCLLLLNAIQTKYNFSFQDILFLKNHFFNDSKLQINEIAEQNHPPELKAVRPSKDHVTNSIKSDEPLIIAEKDSQEPLLEERQRNASSIESNLDPSEPIYPLNNKIIKSSSLNKGELLTFLWTDPKHATEYKLQISPSQSFETLFFEINVESNSYTLQFELPIQTFYWRVRAQYGPVTGPWSRSQTFKIIP
ncbi:MAG: serine/threonine protein kinase [Bdellovibrionales bacterium]|nr:serine/threonine protein kinase [Bdellovibrionales bacterium]